MPGNINTVAWRYNIDPETVGRDSDYKDTRTFLTKAMIGDIYYDTSAYTIEDGKILKGWICVENPSTNYPCGRWNNIYYNAEINPEIYSSRGEISPEAYGAKGNGIDDDTNAIQLMFINHPAVVKLRGKYLIRDIINITSSCEIQGGEIIIDDNFASGSDRSVFFINAPNCSFSASNITFRYQPSDTTNTQKYADIVGFRISNAGNTAFRNISSYRMARVIKDDGALDLTSTVHYQRSCIIDGIYAEGNRSIAHLSDCKNYSISNVTAKTVVRSNDNNSKLVCALFYCRPNCNIQITNLYAEDGEGSILHCNREIDTVAQPPYAENDMRKTTIQISNAKIVNFGRFADINSYASIVGTNIEFSGRGYDVQRGFIEMLNGCGTVDISNSNITNVDYMLYIPFSINVSIPTSFKDRKVSFSNCKATINTILKTENTATGADIELKDCEFIRADSTSTTGPFFSMYGDFSNKEIKVNGCTFNADNKAVIFQLATENASLDITNSKRKATTPGDFVYAINTSKNNNVSISYTDITNTSKIYNDAGTSNTIKPYYLIPST